tara:strand:+ start:3209 stop:3508 length:300 start_codon:yes stop_codon:yes gene_type:complete
MKLTKRQLQLIVRESLVEAYEKTEYIQAGLGERYRMKESMDMDPSFYADVSERYDGDIAYERVMAVIEVLAAYPAAHSYLDIEDVASEIIDSLEEKGLI